MGIFLFCCIADETGTEKLKYLLKFPLLAWVPDSVLLSAPSSPRVAGSPELSPLRCTTGQLCLTLRVASHEQVL